MLKLYGPARGTGWGKRTHTVGR